MIRKYASIRLQVILSGILIAFCVFGVTNFAYAATQTESGAEGVEGTVQGPPPSTAPTIATPSNGASFTTMPVTVSGLCQTGLLVKVFANNIFVGSVTCTSGSYSVQVDLFSGSNQITAQQYDALGQNSPTSNIVTATYVDAYFATYGTQLTLTSQYAEKGADPGQTLTWPVTLSGGTGPYAVSTNWGDGTSATLQSVSFTGVVDLTHVYATAGTYNVTVKATDKNGETAFLQVVGVANGQATPTTAGTNSKTTSTSGKTTVLWQPAAISIPLIIVAFWLGRRFELAALRKRIERGWRS